MSTREQRPVIEDEPDVREHLSHGLSRSQAQRELRRGVAPALLVLGLAVLTLATLLLVARNVNGGRSPLADSRQVRIAVADASGVVPNQNEVRISGMRVGRITDVALRNDQATLTLDIDERFGVIYRNAKLRLRPSTPLNDLFVDVVDRGTPAAGEATSDVVLPSTATSVPVQFAKALDTFQPVTRKRMQRFISQFGPALADNGEQLQAAFVELKPFLVSAERISDQVALHRTQTRRLVHNLRLMLDTLAERETDVRGLVRNGARTMTALGENAGPLDRTLAELPATLSQTRRTFTTLPPALTRARQAFVALRPVAADLPPALEALQALSQDLRPAARGLRPTVARLDSLFTQARPLSRTLSGAFADLRPSAPRLDVATKELEGCRTAVAQFFQDTLSVFKFSNKNNAIPRGELVVNNPGDLVAAKSCAPGGPRK